MSRSRRSEARHADLALARRAAPPPTFRHDPELPVTALRADFLAALQAHRVVIVAGDTGSGKSTQLPQFCLEAGRGIEGLIAHTQPRRIAARALAARISEELARPVGDTVGFRVRFADRVSPATRLVLMTDGLLLSELNSDRLLRRYDTVIVDEAHERTLNVDLLLGVLKRLLTRRDDLKVIVTSATLDVERMARFFGDAPVIRVSGRGHPIEVRYREPAAQSGEEEDLPTAVLQAYRELQTEPGAVGDGDVLVFLPGEREIGDVGELLEREVGDRAEIVPLYSRLAWEQQSKVFEPGRRRRIVLATNVAETSITVPGIRVVIDSGLARISRYSARNRLQRLPIEPISRASAEQRKGRCGRIGPGLCLRLYSEADFAVRPEFTDAEILRTNLAALLLRLAADDLGAAEEFPFLDPPDARARGDGYRLLEELGALDARHAITRHGRAMARLPLDPRLARALLESQRFRAESEVLAIVSGLSVPDVRLPRSASTDGAGTAGGAGVAGAAGSAGGAGVAGGAGTAGGAGSAGAGSGAELGEDTLAAADTKSEFLSLVRLWRAYRTVREGPRRELRRWCKERGLSLLRLSEWDDVHAQVSERAAELGIVAGRGDATYTAVHRALLAGFCSMIGLRGEEGIYQGTRGVRFAISPGSALRRRKPRWVMAANIVETSRVYAQRLAEIQPMWIEAAAGGLLKREYLEPDWSEVREEVVARERVSFLGLILSADRTVNYGPIAPEESRRIFAREALVYGRLRQRPDWLVANDAALDAARRLEERLRTRDLVVDPETLVGFYDRALPRQVSSAATLEYFSRRMTSADRAALTLDAQSLYARLPDQAALSGVPDRALERGLQLPIEYRFAPGESDDGATLKVPLLALPELTQAAVAAAVPGFVRPRAEALLRTLPKEARRALIPIAETAAQFVAATGPAAGELAALATWLKQVRGIAESLLRFAPGSLEPYLLPQVAVTEGTREIGRGRDVAALRRALAVRAQAALEQQAAAAFPAAWPRFLLDRLPDRLTLALAEGSLDVHPALTAAGARVTVSLHWTAAEAERQLLRGATALAGLLLEREVRELAKRVREDVPLLLAASPFARGEALNAALVALVLRRACFAAAETGGVPREREAFEAAVAGGRERLHDELTAARAQALDWFTEARSVRRLLDDPRTRGFPEAAAAAGRHLQQLLDLDELPARPLAQLEQLVRYLRAAGRRWQRLLARGTESPAIEQQLADWETRLHSLRQQLAAERRRLPAFEDLVWWLEEFRVSLYAQELKTARPVSAPRLERLAAEIEAWLRR
jgi:ATP-dependent helicase HrpA